MTAGNPADSPVGNPEPSPAPAWVGLLSRVRYEVLPLQGTAEQVGEHVPLAIPVTVTASPRRGLEPTVALTESLAAAGYKAVPHLAARLVRDDAHLAEILARLNAVGVGDVFVVAGDGRTPVGRFDDALGLLQAIATLRASGVARSLRHVGVTGYPEGHPLVSEADLARALLAKAPLSSYVVTQMCFDASAIDTWLASIRRLGVTAPVNVGVAGAVERARLLRVAARIGVGASLRVVRKHRGGSRLVRTGGYRPDRLLEELGRCGVAASGRIAGLHVYTLGDVAATERWRAGLAERLVDARDDQQARDG